MKKKSEYLVERGVGACGVGVGKGVRGWGGLGGVGDGGREGGGVACNVFFWDTSISTSVLFTFYVLKTSLRVLRVLLAGKPWYVSV